MSVQAILAEIPQLTVEEQLALLEAITKSLRVSIAPLRPASSALADRLYGAFKTEGPPPTDAEIEHIRYEALLEKHS